MTWIVKIQSGEKIDFARDENGNLKEFIGYKSANDFANNCEDAVCLINRLTNAVFPIQKSENSKAPDFSFEDFLKWGGLNHAK